MPRDSADCDVVTAVTAHSTLMGGSIAERRMNCLASYRLESQHPEPPTSVYAAQGTMLHSVTEKHLTGTPMPDLYGYEEEGCVFDGDLEEELIQPALDCLRNLQIALEIDDLEFLTEARVAFQDFDAFGTVDLMGTSAHHTIILDWKFGRGVKAGPGALRYQLPFYAAAARNTPEVADMFADDKKIVLAVVQPAMNQPLTYKIVDHADLDAFEARVRAAILAINADIEMDPTPGKWCRWCRAAAVCPARTGAASAIVSDNIEAETLDADEIGYYLGVASELEDWIRAIRSHAHRTLDAGDKVTGYKLVQRRKTRRWSDKDGAERFLRSHGVNEIFEDPKLVSPARAEKLLKDAADSDDLQQFITSTSTGSTVAPHDDPRPAIELTNHESE